MCGSDVRNFDRDLAARSTKQFWRSSSRIISAPHVHLYAFVTAVPLFCLSVSHYIHTPFDVQSRCCTSITCRSCPIDATGPACSSTPVLPPPGR